MSMVRRVCWVTGWACLAAGVAACSGAKSEPRVAASTPAATISRVHKARCGSCHVRVEPGERSRQELETAFTRHRRRVHLSEEQWGEMVEYLAVK
jgi:hypothetical protein